ncbi:hypothetical protein QML11_28300, partial [Klebsiella pneumoniae]|uniref:hypothetical protein n=1 Tax=Klebsiella pneumoniae TaxID=573 RepID=UPI003A882B8A
GQDELVFDGHSVVIDHEGTVLARAPQFAEALTLCTVDLQAAATARLRDTRLRPPVRRALPDVRHLGTLERRPRDGRPLGGDVAGLLEPGNPYAISAAVRFAPGATVGQGLTLSARTVSGGTQNFSNLLQIENATA